MTDQAQTLREMKKIQSDESPLEAPAVSRRRIIAVTSGKGGVGKSNIALNLGISLTRFGHRVMIVDADFGLASIDLLLGISPRYNLTHVISGKKRLDEIMITGPSGIRVLPANSNARLTPDMNYEKRSAIISAIRSDTDLADTVFIDTAAGISDNIIDFLLLADEVMLVTTPEPTSLMDSYGIIKILARERERTIINLLVNMAQDRADADHVVNTMRLITGQFFNVEMQELGWIGFDPNVSKSVRRQQPFVLLHPSSRASKDVTRVAMRMADYDVDFITDRGLPRLIRRMISLWK